MHAYYKNYRYFILNFKGLHLKGKYSILTKVELWELLNVYPSLLDPYTAKMIIWNNDINDNYNSICKDWGKKNLSMFYSNASYAF